MAKETLEGTVEKIIVLRHNLYILYFCSCGPRKKARKTAQGRKNQMRNVMKLLGALWLKGETCSLLSF